MNIGGTPFQNLPNSRNRILFIDPYSLWLKVEYGIFRMDNWNEWARFLEIDLSFSLHLCRDGIQS